MRTIIGGTLMLASPASVQAQTSESNFSKPNVLMTGYNRGPNAITKVLIHYVSDPETPFLDPHH